MDNSLRSVLIVDRETAGRKKIAASIRKDIGCIVLEADTPAAALALLEQETVCLMVAAFPPGTSGERDLLRKVQAISPQTVLIAATPEGDREKKVESLKNGAFSCIGLPYDPHESVIMTARALYYYDLLFHQEKRGAKIRKSDGFQGIIGQSGEMQRLFRMIQLLAEDNVSTVLVQGESGTGKEMVARAIHSCSARSEKNFVPVNCAAIPEELLESELFGHAKGAFTGATQAKMGRFQYAEGGTLFLDEIGDMQPALQAKLLRVLQEKEFEPVGDVRPIRVNVRVIAATHRNLEKMVEEGSFREDLYYRLNVIPLPIPPLRERKDDIPLLIDKFSQIFNRNRKTRLRGFDPKAIAALIGYPWPGNIRELENLVQRMVVLHGGETVTVRDLPEQYVRPHAKAAPPPPTSPEPREVAWEEGVIDFNGLVDDFETRLIVRALEHSGGNKKEAAGLLNMKRTTLLEKIRKKNLPF